MQVRQKIFILFCSKSIQETTHKISPEAPEFYRRYYFKKHVSVFFLDTVYSEFRRTSSALYVEY